MNIVIPVKLVPDLVEELEISDEGTSLDTTFMRLILNEFDEHAIEQGVILKNNIGGQLTVITLNCDGADDVLFTASAKGADTLIKVSGPDDGSINSHAIARALRGSIETLGPDLILTGVQAHDNLDGAVGPLLAACLGMPYVGYISAVSISDGLCLVKKEYPGGLVAELEVEIPAVLGIQAAEEPPRYIAISKVRQAKKSAEIAEEIVEAFDMSGGPQIERMFLPEAGERAEMITGDEDAIATQVVEVLQGQGFL